MAKEITFEVAQRIAKRTTARYQDLGLHNQADDIAAKAFKELHRAMAKEEILNPEAFMTWKIKNLVLDSLRQYRARDQRLQVWASEIEALKGPRLHDNYDHRAGRIPLHGLSNEYIAQEEQAMVDLIASAMWQIMPNLDDQKILRQRFFGQCETITELAKECGKSPTSLANYLKKLLGSDGEPGALSSVSFVLQQVSLRTGSKFVHEIGRLDETSVVSNPVEGAIAYLELVGTSSRAHQQQAAKGLAHLRWLQVNKPSNRGLPNKILNRLIHAACLYVMEPNDARHDRWSEVGLLDDLAVVKAVQKAVAKFSK